MWRCEIKVLGYVLSQKYVIKRNKGVSGINVKCAFVFAARRHTLTWFAYRFSGTTCFVQ